MLSPAFRRCRLRALRRKSRLEYPFLGLFFFVGRDFSAVPCFLQLIELAAGIRRAVEFFLRLALKDFAKRDEIVLATKVHGQMRADPNGKGLSRKAILTEIDHSLKRLQTDYVDLIQITA